jgi:hypothetical protein
MCAALLVQSPMAMAGPTNWMITTTTTTLSIASLSPHAARGGGRERAHQAEERRRRTHGWLVRAHPRGGRYERQRTGQPGEQVDDQRVHRAGDAFEPHAEQADDEDGDGEVYEHLAGEEGREYRPRLIGDA